jgi:serine kinase of HPr protein (carbohydrate metabolism regulator)
MDGTSSFQSLQGTSYTPSLDNVRKYKFTGNLLLLNEKNLISELEIFECIHHEVIKRKGVEKLNRDEIYRRIHFLLSHIEFIFELKQEDLQNIIDNEFLRPIVDNIEDLESKRNALITALAKLAARNSEIIPAKFLEEQNINAVPLTNLREILLRNRKCIDSYFKTHNYQPSEDIRIHNTSNIIYEWSKIDGMIITGESGLGKSWSLYSIANYLIGEDEIVILIDSQGKLLDDENEAARVFSHDIRDSDGIIPLDRISGRLHKDTKKRKCIYLLIDGASNYDEAKQITNRNWRDWNIKVAVTCLPDISQEMSSWGKYDICAFNEDELQNYLDMKLGNDWPNIPPDIRNTLKIPLLARIYCEEIKKDSEWKPVNEYELYSRYWQRLSKGNMAHQARDRSCFKSLGYEVLNNCKYPWTDNMINNYLDSEAIERLIQKGWLRYQEPSNYEVPHDRLLNWLVAEAIFEKMQNTEISDGDVCCLLSDLWNGTRKLSCGYLGYVPLDVLFLTLRSGANHHSLVIKIFDMFEGDLFIREEELYNEYLPAFDSDILPFVFEKLEGYVLEDNYRRYALIQSLKQYKEIDIYPYVEKYLNSDSSYLKRTALKILAIKPNSKYLDKIWEIHCDIANNYKDYAYEHEKHQSYIYGNSFAALKACVLLDHVWLKTTIDRVENHQPVHDLAYLLAYTGNKVLWQNCKQKLFDKVSPDKKRCLANCISTFTDKDEIGWLQKNINVKEDFLGESALRALCKVAPDLAIRNIQQCSNIYFTRSWHIHLLLKIKPDETRKKLLDHLQKSSSPWKAAMIYQGGENNIDYNTLDYLLNELENILDEIEINPTNCNEYPLWPALEFLDQLWNLEHINCFHNRVNSGLEKKLSEYILRKGGRVGVYMDHELAYGTNLLYKIGGMGIVKVINQWLKCDRRYAHLDALRLAYKNYDNETIDLLTALSLSEELWDGYAVIQGEATQVLKNMEQYKPVVNSIMQWGMKTLAKVCETFPCFHRTPDYLKTAIESINSGIEHINIIGSVMVLGIFNQKQFANKIYDILCQSDIHTDLAHACIISLGRLQTQKMKVVEKFGELLKKDIHKYSVSLALLRIDTNETNEILLDSLRRTFDYQIAVNLIRKDNFRERTVELLKKHLANANFIDTGFIYDAFLHYIDYGGNIYSIFDDVEIKHKVLETLFSNRRNFKSSKENIIELYSYFDKKKALTAAKYHFENIEVPNRNSLPELVMKIAPELSAKYLFNRVMHERDVYIQWAIGRALASVDLSGIVKDSLFSENKYEIIAALRIIGWGNTSEPIEVVVNNYLLDGDYQIEYEAKQALNRIENMKELSKVLDELKIEQNNVKKWILLDAALNIGDPGDISEGWPKWLSNITDVLTQPMRIHAGNTIRKKKEELQKQAKKLTENHNK